jgi:hypothetical protein
MTTKATEDFPEIEWEDLKQDLLCSDVEEREEIYLTTGMDKEGVLYFGSAVFVCGEFEGIKDIDKVIKVISQPKIK